MLASLIGACSPTLDWRRIEVDDDALQAQFPCRPDRHERDVQVAGSGVRMRMLVCTAGAGTYAVSYFDVAEPAGVGTALAALRSTAALNLGANEPALIPFVVPGMTPNRQSGHATLQGRLPDGGVVAEQALFFARGLRVYQASVLGASLAMDASEPFFSGLKLGG